MPRKNIWHKTHDTHQHGVHMNNLVGSTPRPASEFGHIVVLHAKSLGWCASVWTVMTKIAHKCAFAAHDLHGKSCPR